MTTAEMFQEFLSNLVIENSDTISLRYGELTSALNRRFRDTESKTDNSLQVGSFGRKTGINGISDLDMLYLMPKSEWTTYKASGPQKLLQDTRSAILGRYPTTKVSVDRCVVSVTYANFHVEVQPVFEQDDGSYKYPDTKNGGSWRVTMPREEMAEVSRSDKDKNGNLRRLCKMARAWKNKHGVAIGGLLIDTLAYNFLRSTSDYDLTGFSKCDYMCRDFFKYLADQPEQECYYAPGSRQRVAVKRRFQGRAKKAHKLCVAAIEAGGSKGVNDKWKKIFGRPFPAKAEEVVELSAGAAKSWRNTEEFIEDQFPVDIRYNLTLDCDVKQNGFRDAVLSFLLENGHPLLANKSLRFRIVENDVPPPFEVKWKVLNRGEIAQKKDKIRGQIIPDKGRSERTETTNFKGDHVVECFIVKDGIVVAKDRIHVPIASNSKEYEEE